VLLLAPALPGPATRAAVDNTLGSSLANKVDLKLFDNTGCAGMSRIAAIKHCVNIIRRQQPDVIHVLAEGDIDFSQAATIVFARLLGVKVILHNHGSDPSDADLRSFLGRRYLKLVLGRCHRVIAASQSAKDNHAKLISASRIELARSAVLAAPYEFNLHGSRARHMLGIHRDKVVVLVMGAMGKRGGAADVIHAAPLVARMDPSVQFVLVGSQDDVSSGAIEELKKLRKDSNAEDSVDGRVETDESRRRLYYAAADILVMPCNGDTLPVPILEAMASKLPVISSSAGAVPEMVDHEKTGLLVQPGRPSEIAEAIVKLSKDQHLRKEMGHAALKKFRHLFDMERVCAPALWHAYRDLALGPKAAPDQQPAAPISAEDDDLPDDEAQAPEAAS